MVTYDGIRLRIDLAYVGTAFHGWQLQPDRRTVQGELEAALVRLLARPVRPLGAGRTDTGVHALGQVAHVTVDTEDEVERIMRALPGMLPPDIQIHDIRRVSRSFHALASAKARRYEYHLQLSPDLFRPYCWQIIGNLKRESMDAAAAEFMGAHDFTSFCKTASLKDDGNICVVDHCRFQWSDDSAIFQVCANRFLHHMVRIMVGTMVDLGRSRRQTTITEILANRSRSASGGMAPAAGLFLAEVIYPEILLDPNYRDPDLAAPEDGPAATAPNSSEEGETP